MIFIKQLLPLGIILIFNTFTRLDAITVSPLCPTNKIAPRRKSVDLDRTRERTFGAFYDLLTPNNFQNDASFNDLQEKPQEDDPDDCGEIEDYDENDLSSVTSQSQRRKGARHNEAFFGDFFNIGGIQKPPVAFQTQRPYTVTRQPFWSGGLFAGNFYRPPPIQNPSDYVKPVHEETQATDSTYNPHIVGGPLGHIVGFPTVKPTTGGYRETKLVRTPRYYYHDGTSTSSPLHRTRRPTTRQHENTVFGSFVDLFFK